MVRGLPGVDPHLQLPTTQVLSRQLHCVRRIRFFSRGQLQVWARTQQNITTERKRPRTGSPSRQPNACTGPNHSQETTEQTKDGY